MQSCHTNMSALGVIILDDDSQGDPDLPATSLEACPVCFGLFPTQLLEDHCAACCATRFSDPAPSALRAQQQGPLDAACQRCGARIALQDLEDHMLAHRYCSGLSHAHIIGRACTRPRTSWFTRCPTVMQLSRRLSAIQQRQSGGGGPRDTHVAGEVRTRCTGEPDTVAALFASLTRKKMDG